MINHIGERVGRLDLIFIVSVIVIWVIADIVLRKKLGIPRKTDHTFQRWLSKKGIYLFAGLVLIFVIVSIISNHVLGVYYNLLLFSGLFGYLAVLQWRHEKSSKQYVRTAVSSLALLVLFIGLVVAVYPREFHQTYEAVKYADDNEQGGHVTIEFQGQTWQNLLYGKSFLGTLKVDDDEFLVLQYWEEHAETLILDRMKGTYRPYTMIETDGNQRGTVWLSSDLASFAGSFSATKFVHPAETVEEAENLFNVIFNR